MWREKETLCKQVIFFSVLTLDGFSLSENKDSAIQGAWQGSHCPLYLWLYLLSCSLLLLWHTALTWPPFLQLAKIISCLRATTHAVPPPQMLFLQILHGFLSHLSEAVLTYCLCGREALPGHLMYSNDSLPIISSYFLCLINPL